MEDFRLMFCHLVEQYRLPPEIAAALLERILQIRSQHKEETP